jgi:toxin-antitoxin system PIN domain toxin
VIACDVNVLVYAFDQGAPRHAEYRAWLEAAANDAEPFGLSSIVASGFLRIFTHPKVLARPITVDVAVELIDGLRTASAVVPFEPGRQHWTLFTNLCRAVTARGNAVPDAYLAALAIEHGATWYTADRGFARYPGLRVRHPLDAPATR